MIPTTPAADPPVAGRRTFLARAGLVSAVLVGSGAIRLWQTRKVDAAMRAGLESPFPLDQLPMNFGDYRGTRTEMDPRIVRGTGCTDMITRRYVNQKTGVSMEVIVLYGPPLTIFGHTPEACYPAAGFRSNGDAIAREIETGDGPTLFRSVAFVKDDSGPIDSQEIYYSWRFGGRWTPAIGGPRDISRIPGMYKIQVSRRLQPYESRTVHNPCEPFLQALVPEMESRITGHPGPTAAASRI